MVDLYIQTCPVSYSGFILKAITLGVSFKTQLSLLSNSKLVAALGKPLRAKESKALNEPVLNVNLSPFQKTVPHTK